MNRAPATPPSTQAVKTGGGSQGSPPFLDDQRLEEAIETTRQALVGAKTREMRVELAEQMRRLISQRSPWMIAKMEKERGLR